MWAKTKTDMSKNYKPKPIMSTRELNAKEENIMRRLADKEKIEKENQVKQLDWQLEDADKIKVIIDHIKTLENLFNALNIKSTKGKLAKKYINEKLQSASSGGYSLYNKLR